MMLCNAVDRRVGIAHPPIEETQYMEALQANFLQVSATYNVQAGHQNVLSQSLSQSAAKESELFPLAQDCIG